MKNNWFKKIKDQIYTYLILPIFILSLCAGLGIFVWQVIKPQEISDSTRKIESGYFYEEDHYEELYNAPVNNNTGGNKIVYIAPHSGERYHYNKSCEGLEDAMSVDEMELGEAQEQGYTECGF